MEITSANDDIHFSRQEYTNGNRYVAQKQAAPKKKREFPDWRRFAAGDDQDWAKSGPNFNPNGPAGEQTSFDQMGPMTHGQADPSDLFGELSGQQAPPPACPHCGQPIRDKKSASAHKCAGDDSNADGADPEDVRAENEDNSVGADDTDTDGAEAQGDAGKQSRRRQAFNPNDPWNKSHKDDPDVKAQRDEYEKNLSSGDKWDDFKQHMKQFFHGGDGPGPMDAGGMAALLGSRRTAAEGNCGLCKGDGNAPWGDSCPACDGSGNKTKESSRREAWIRRRAQSDDEDDDYVGDLVETREHGSPGRAAEPHSGQSDDEDDDYVGDLQMDRQKKSRRTARFSAVDSGAALFL